MTSEPLLAQYDTLLSDLDGVVYAGPYAIEGAPEALNRAESSGVPVVFVTNNASRSVESVAAHLQGTCCQFCPGWCGFIGSTCARRV